MQCVVTCVLSVCIGNYPKSVLRYKFLILDTCHPDTTYLCEQRCEDPCLFFETKRGLRDKKFAKNRAISQGHCKRYFEVIFAQSLCHDKIFDHRFKWSIL